MSPRAGAYALTPAQLRSWLDDLIASGYEVVAPVSGRGPLHFAPINAADEAALEPGVGVGARWSPKEYLLPRRETLLSYWQDNGSVHAEQPSLDTQPRVLIGLTPCDAAGLERLAAVFRTGQGDPHVQARCDATINVTFTCAQTAPQCFCTAVGGSPGDTEGSDVQLTMVDDDLEPIHVLRALTGKGEQLIEHAHGAWTLCDEHLQARAHQAVRAVEAELTRQPLPDDASGILARSFNDDAWQSVAEPCLGCRVCTTVCPSCSCFDVYDEGSAACGERCRCWDGCTQQLFTTHATGHNPRPGQLARFRQRVMHKFSYFPTDHDGLSMCVGCGRCAASCPAGLDVHEIVMRVIERSQSSRTQGAGHDE